ncbi:MAG: S8 family serine peptidase, partial [Myxococcota bacterium]
MRALSFGWALYDLLPAGDHRRASEEVTRELIARLHRDPLVRASEDRWVHPFATPNDPGMSYLWHYESIGTRAGWDVTTGLSTQRVGVVDTGTVVTHQDLAAKVVDGYDFIYETDFSVDGDGRDDDFTDPGDGGNCGYGYMDHSWHGSHVAGTIVASTNNGVGIAGLSWGAKLVTGRALGRCGGTTVDIFEAMAWMSGYAIEGVPNLAAANVVDVVNLSLGADEACSDVEADYIGTILAQTDVVIVAAAGNSGNGVPVSSPANCPGVLSVGAFGPGANRPLANYSNFSADLDIVAPGGDDNEGVLSACGGSNDCYQYQAGTSMAAPHIAGAVSLLRAVNPTLSQDDIRTVLRSTGATCTGCGNIPALQLDAAVREAALMAGGTGVPAAAPEPVPSPTPEPATEPDEEPGPAPEPSPVDGSVGACDPRRGNWDCANGEGCVENAAGVAECRAGAEGESKSGGLCDLDDDCASGLCDRGVCTVPCDAGCRDG